MPLPWLWCSLHPGVVLDQQVQFIWQIIFISAALSCWSRLYQHHREPCSPAAATEARGCSGRAECSSMPCTRGALSSAPITLCCTPALLLAPRGTAWPASLLQCLHWALEDVCAALSLCLAPSESLTRFGKKQRASAVHTSLWILGILQFILSFLAQAKRTLQVSKQALI